MRSGIIASKWLTFLSGDLP